MLAADIAKATAEMAAASMHLAVPGSAFGDERVKAGATARSCVGSFLVVWSCNGGRGEIASTTTACGEQDYP